MGDVSEAIAGISLTADALLSSVGGAMGTGHVKVKKRFEARKLQTVLMCYRLLFIIQSGVMPVCRLAKEPQISAINSVGQHHELECQHRCRGRTEASQLVEPNNDVNDV